MATRYTGSAIAIDLSCESTSTPPAFGPFETYTAEEGSLELYSAVCGFRALYRAISSDAP